MSKCGRPTEVCETCTRRLATAAGASITQAAHKYSRLFDRWVHWASRKTVPLGAIPAGSIHPAAKKAPSSRDGALTKGIHSQRWQRVRSVWPFYDGLTATR
jgi:hypothetical protein